MRLRLKLVIVKSMLLTAILVTVGHYGTRAASNDDLLEIVFRGTSNAASLIKTGKGLVTVRNQSFVFDEERKECKLINDSEEEYYVAYSEGVYRISVMETILLDIDSALIGSRRSNEILSTQENLVTMLRGGKVTKFTAPSGFTNINPDVMLAYMRYAHAMKRVGWIGQDLPGHGIVILESLSHSANPAVSGISFRVSGREILDGVECIVVEKIEEHNASSPSYPARVDVFWVCPDKGFTVPRVQRYVLEGSERTRVLQQEARIVLKEYQPEIWYPLSITTEYHGKNKDGENYVLYRQEVVYSSDFQINEPVMEADLSLNLPSGTQVRDLDADMIYTIP